MHEHATPLREDDPGPTSTVRSMGDIGSLYGAISGPRLSWFPEIGIGYYPVRAGLTPYDDEYFNRYARQADTDLGRALMKVRVSLVGSHWGGKLVDVGIGCGAFIDARDAVPGLAGRTVGYDVNPAGRDWLEARSLWYDIESAESIEAVSLWDVLEHISDPLPLLDKVSNWVFVSLPIFEGPDHVLRSKHYRKDEHFWYFTDRGLRWFMGECGFGCAESNHIETDLGREDIGSYAFRRVARRASGPSEQARLISG